MKSFLQEHAEKIYAIHPKLDELTIVFPNRRASLYFKKHLGNLLTKPSFAPQLTTIEDFIASFSEYSIPDKLELVHRLYKVYQATMEIKEPFEKFFFWGEMLLKDFDEVDKYCVSASQLFKDLSHQKELDASFDFLADEQLEFLKSFWGSFDKNMTANKQKFLHVWKELPLLYEIFKKELHDNGLAYDGMMHRNVAERLSRNELRSSIKKGNLIFLGFNALTKAEEIIISHFIDEGTANIYWDLDEYYVNNERQEAGDFFREYQKLSSFAKTFPADVPANFRSGKSIKIYGAAQLVGQAKLMAQLLNEEINKGIEPEETVIVLPDERLLFPVLHGISDDVEKLNVSMGFPLSNTPLFNLIELLFDLQINERKDQFNHRQVIAILGHPYGVAADAGDSQRKSKEIVNSNWISIDGEFLRSGPALYHLIFASIHPKDLGKYLREIVIAIGFLPSVSSFDKEYVFHFIKLLNRIEEVLIHDNEAIVISRKEAFQSFLRLFRQLVRGGRIPFSGEPLKGLQVMGVLETRNIDFKNVFILSLNEGVFPSISSKGSYIPFSIRKAYKLPTVDHQDSMYAYLFYRVLQRAENIFLLYNSETDVLGQGEMSRFLQQLLFESGLDIEKNILHTPIRPKGGEPITIQKDERIFDRLALYCLGQRGSKTLSPTALNDYIECRLRFYFKYVAGMREPREVQEDLDARMLGNLLHKVMQYFYQNIKDEKGSNIIHAEDLENWEERIDRHIDFAFREEYGIRAATFEYHGQRLVVKEIILSFVKRILELDKAYAPFKIEALEREDLKVKIPIDVKGKPVIVLSGAIDRADSKDRVLRIIDYKTGRDKGYEIKGTVQDVFVREGARSKAAFQTLMYALLYTENANTADLQILPGLMNRMNLFEENFRFGLKIGNQYVTDIRPYLPQFKESIKKMLEELFNTDQPFDQTLNTENCRNCPYNGICYR